MITVIAGQANTVGVDIIDPATGAGVESGTVALYLVQRRGDDAGKWWNAATEAWSATEASAGDATHESQGHWTAAIATEAWTSGNTYRLYGVLDAGSYVSHSLDVLCVTVNASWPGSTGTWPVTIDELKAHLRIDSDDTTEDQLLDAYLGAATRWAEGYNGRKFLTATCVEKFDVFPAVFRPMGSPLAAVTSITYVDSAGVTQTVDAADYLVDTTTQPGRITPAYGESWPSPRDQINAVTLTYTAGYGADGSDVPQTVRSAIVMIAGALYENREDTTPIAVHDVPFGARALLGIDRLIHV